MDKVTNTLFLFGSNGDDDDDIRLTEVLGEEHSSGLKIDFYPEECLNQLSSLSSIPRSAFKDPYFTMDRKTQTTVAKAEVAKYLITQSWEVLPILRRTRISYKKIWMTL
ncbi:unnamed protein product [Caretta caretta]